jgi:hypothetical protein
VTFFIPRTNVIESDEGYSVEILGPVGLRYSQGGRVLFVDSEMLAGSDGLIIYSGSMKVESSADASSSVDFAEATRVIENIREAFRFRGFEIQVA